MRFSIKVGLRLYDSPEAENILTVTGASEETRNLILEKYNGPSYIIFSEPEETLLMSEDINTLDLSLRTYNCLYRADIKTIPDLVKTYNKGKLINVRNLGRRSYEEVENKLLSLNLIQRRVES